MHSVGFTYYARPDAQLLILGSLPGQASLAAQEYYAQPHNAFWRIMGELFGAAKSLPYATRLECLVQHRIALWDVCKAGERPGSLDSAINLTTVIPNDFAAFFVSHPQIERICFNGNKAAEIYRRKALPTLTPAFQTIPHLTLPSTSPAHAGMKFAQKLERWRAGLTL